MIGCLKGKIIEKSLDNIILDVSGVGYKIFTQNEIIGNLKVGVDSLFWTFLSVKETSLDLYGFINKKDLEFFKMLLTISGVGPKSALAIMDTAPTKVLIEGIQSGDANYLSKISGISSKKSEKILIALKDKVGLSDILTDSNVSSGTGQDILAIDALVSLGYSEKESRTAIAEIKSEIKEDDNAGNIIKKALKKLGS